MRRWLQAMRVASAVLLTLLVISAGVSHGWHKQVATVSIISPPPGVSLPVGQGIEVRYQAAGAAFLKLWVAPGDSGSPGDLLAVDHIRGGREIAHFWSPAAEGRYCFIVTVSETENPRAAETLKTATCCVTALPTGSPVRLNANK